MNVSNSTNVQSAGLSAKELLKIQKEEVKRIKKENAEEAKRVKKENAEEAKRIKKENAEEAKRIKKENAEEAKRIKQQNAEEAKRIKQEKKVKSPKKETNVPTEPCSNESVKQHLAENKQNKKINLMDKLHEEFPGIDIYTLTQICERYESGRQSMVQNNGDCLEQYIATHLRSNNIPFLQQVTIDSNGVISGFNEKKTRCGHVIDIVVGSNIDIGNHISNHIVLSCKTTCRERWTQDDWTLKNAPSKYILITTTEDYPSSTRFAESHCRKIMTCSPKKNDERLYKLNFEELIGEVNA